MRIKTYFRPSALHFHCFNIWIQHLLKPKGKEKEKEVYEATNASGMLRSGNIPPDKYKFNQSEENVSKRLTES